MATSNTLTSPNHYSDSPAANPLEDDGYLTMNSANIQSPPPPAALYMQRVSKSTYYCFTLSDFDGIHVHCCLPNVNHVSSHVCITLL